MLLIFRQGDKAEAHYQLPKHVKINVDFNTNR